MFQNLHADTCILSLRVRKGIELHSKELIEYYVARRGTSTELKGNETNLKINEALRN